MRCIDKNILLSQLPKTEQADADETFIDPSALLQKFKEFPAIVTNTYKLMDACTVDMDFNQDKTKKTFSSTPEDDRVLLEMIESVIGTRTYKFQTNIVPPKESQEEVSGRVMSLNNPINIFSKLQYDVSPMGKMLLGEIGKNQWAEITVRTG